MSRWRVPSPALRSHLPPPKNALPGRLCHRAVIVGRGGWCSGTPGLLPPLLRGPFSTQAQPLLCPRLPGPSRGPRLRGSDSRGALCCWCGCPRHRRRPEKRPLCKTPRAGFEPLVDLADHPGVRQPPALSESQQPASLAAGQQGGPCASR